MIPAAPSQYEAVCIRTVIPGRDPVEVPFPVVAWSDEGDALVVSQETGRLVPPDRLDGFLGLRECAPPFLGVVGGGGWRIEVAEEDGRRWTTPVIAWQVRQFGAAMPVLADPNGVVGYRRDFPDAVRVFHPDTEKTDAPTTPEA